MQRSKPIAEFCGNDYQGPIFGRDIVICDRSDKVKRSSVAQQARQFLGDYDKNSPDFFLVKEIEVYTVLPYKPQ